MSGERTAPQYIMQFGLEKVADGRYLARAECQNCHQREAIQVLKGIPSKKVKMRPCSNCGCKEFIVYA